MTEFHCPECKKGSIEITAGSRSRIECPSCRRSFDVFAYRDSPTPAECRPSTRISESETACFNHSNYRAEHVCDICGRLICPLCSFTFFGEPVCANCISSRQSGRPILPLEHRRILFDGLAFRLALWPMILIYPTLFTGPLAIFTAIWNWRKPSSIVPRTKIRAVAAIAIGLAQLGLMVFLIYMIVSVSRQYGNVQPA